MQKQRNHSGDDGVVPASKCLTVDPTHIARTKKKEDKLRDREEIVMRLRAKQLACLCCVSRKRALILAALHGAACFSSVLAV